MRVDLFDFVLPEGQIATQPANPRDSARLMYVPAGAPLQDKDVADLPRLLRAGDVMVFNDTKVIPARLRGKRAEMNAEILLHQKRPDGSWRCFAKPAKRLKDGQRIDFADDFFATVLGREDDGQLLLRFGCDEAQLEDKLNTYGEMPLPPYMHRAAGEADKTAYQTAYAAHAGSVAAPTAGLHFTPALLKAIDDAGIQRVHITLHVGAGTFLPVKVDDTDNHHMHTEWTNISEEAARTINTAKAEGRRIVAVGTTSLRTLESAANTDGSVRAGDLETDIFITPGYTFRTVDALMTNFHLPKSTLLMLVSAFAGRKHMLDAYAHAIQQGYRFYSYGDTSLLEKNESGDF